MSVSKSREMRHLMKQHSSLVPLYLYNTHTGQKELFVPQQEGAVSLYVCGVTPYDHAHIGHGRCYVHFDVLYRLLRVCGYQVTYVRNITDVDDKLIAKISSSSPSFIETVIALARTYFASFTSDMNALGLLAPTKEPKVSENIDAIIAFIQALISQGHAYVVDGDVYFSVESAPTYGNLSGKLLEEQRAGARIEKDKRKKHPADFALWKHDTEGRFWDAPWGNGRPGWHIECSTFVHEYIADKLDIHGGGIDLLFPHHENEAIQTISRTGHPLARYWVHNAHVMIGAEKMSKSMGNAHYLRDLFTKVHPMQLRFFFLQHHYRTPLAFSLDQVKAATKAYKKIAFICSYIPEPALLKKQYEGILISETEDKEVNNPLGALFSTAVQFDACYAPLGEKKAVRYLQAQKVLSEIFNALWDDCNTPHVLGTIFKQKEAIKDDPLLLLALRFVLRELLGLTGDYTEEMQSITLQDCPLLPPDIAHLVQERAQARTEKRWKEADELRTVLAERGYTIVDS